MNKEKLFQVGVKALIKNEGGQILLLQAPGWEKNNTKQHWDIPGGRIQDGQSIETTLKREIKEETGISKIESFELFTAVISNHEIPLEDGYKSGLVLMVYEVELPNNSEIKLSPEHDRYEWVEPATAAKRLANKYPHQFTDLL